VFPEYDLRVQYDSMRLVAQTGLPVPRMRWLEVEDTSVFGAPFYVMGKVAGRAASDRPLYTAEGWLKELAPADQARIWWGGIESMAAIHALDRRALGFGFVDKPGARRHGLDQQLAYYERLPALDGARQAAADREGGLSGCRRTSPSTSPTHSSGATRGSATSCSSRTARRWPRCSTGRWSPTATAEDLAWSIFLDRHHSEGIGLPRLPGFPSYTDTIARYEELTGRQTRWQKFYSVFAGFRFAVIMSRIAQQMVHYGVMPADSTFETNNTVTQLLAKDLGLPAPG
jgi:aminoglycoside phosphotransferase (APT) family kinase protein